MSQPRLTKDMKLMIDAVTSQLGDIPYRIEHGRKHLKVKFTHAGRNETIVVPASKSCRRAHLNARETTRKVLRGVGR